ncbi:MAG: zinc carboxypeptidase, partial [Bacteroidota bacterium]
MKSILLVQFLFLGCLFYAQSFSPEKHFGYKLGTKFTPQHEVVSYFNALQTNFSTKIKIEKYGKTNENRDLILVYIGTVENIVKLEQLKTDHK